MQISVRTVEDKTITVEVEPNDLIESVKAKIQDRKGISVEQQHLVCRGKLLDDIHTLNHYKIQEEWILQLFPNSCATTTSNYLSYS